MVSLYPARARQSCHSRTVGLRGCQLFTGIRLISMLLAPSSLRDPYHDIGELSYIATTLSLMLTFLLYDLVRSSSRVMFLRSTWSQDPSFTSQHLQRDQRRVPILLRTYSRIPHISRTIRRPPPQHLTHRETSSSRSTLWERMGNLHRQDCRPCRSIRWKWRGRERGKRSGRSCLGSLGGEESSENG